MNKNEFALTLQEISTVTARNLPLSSCVAVFPIGSNEQHGPHLPTGTDTIILEAVLEGVRQRFTPEDPFLFMPVMPYGKSPEHMDFPGTVSLKATTLLAVLDDIVSSLHAHGVKRMVFLNSHGGNTSLLNAIVHDFRQTYKVTIACINLWSEEILSAGEIEQIIPRLGYPEIHAASVETSMLQYLRPELVGAIPQEFKPKVPYPELPTGWATIDFSGSGVIGDPRQSSANRGRLLYELLVEKVAARLAGVAGGK